MELTDGVVRLRRFGEGDVAAIARACDDPDNRPFHPRDAVSVRRGRRAPLPRTLRAGVVWTAGRRPLAIVDAATDELLGAIELALGDEPFVGYWVAPRARGGGVATRALRLVVGSALTDGGVGRLTLTTHPRNLASQRVAEKAGFRRVGRRDEPQKFRDGENASIVFELP